MSKLSSINQVIDSHSSALTNQEVHFIQLDIDSKGNIAANTLFIKNIDSYFNAVYNYYMIVKSILSPEVIKNNEELVKHYKSCVELAETDPKTRGKKLLRYMLNCTIFIYSNIRTGLQSEGQYFFRTGNRQMKGLSSVRGLNTKLYTKAKPKEAEQDGKMDEGTEGEPDDVDGDQGQEGSKPSDTDNA